jgi:geranylgeranyl diphosphate synthase type II
MDTDALIEWVLERAIDAATSGSCPPRLAGALRHAVFPGGARVRPRLCLAVAQGVGAEADLPLAAGAGAAIELMHCASLVHDDLPCFDNADERRGNPTVHRKFGEPLAVLCGDALIVAATQTLLREVGGHPDRLVRLITIVGDSVGSAKGIVGGQAWESEEEIDLRAYHRAKTGSLFVASVMSGAAAAGADPAPWQAMGEKLGEAYQIADDIRDVVMSREGLGKPAGQDAVHQRPNAVMALGLKAAVEQLDGLINDTVAAVPRCKGAPVLQAILRAQAVRMVPRSLVAGKV